MAQLYHPDHITPGNDNYEGHEYFLLINEAHDVLSNPELK